MKLRKRGGQDADGWWDTGAVAWVATEVLEAYGDLEGTEVKTEVLEGRWTFPVVLPDDVEPEVELVTTTRRALRVKLRFKPEDER